MLSVGVSRAVTFPGASKIATHVAIWRSGIGRSAKALRITSTRVDRVAMYGLVARIESATKLGVIDTRTAQRTTLDLADAYESNPPPLVVEIRGPKSPLV